MIHKLGLQRFSICLPKEPHEKQNNHPIGAVGGKVIWADEDPRTRAGFEKIPVVGLVHWGVMLSSPKLCLDGKCEPLPGCERGCGTIVDSGTSLFQLPASTLLSIKVQLSKAGIKDCD